MEELLNQGRILTAFWGTPTPIENDRPLELTLQMSTQPPGSVDNNMTFNSFPNVTSHLSDICIVIHFQEKRLKCQQKAMAL